MSAKARHVDYPGFCSLHASRIREVLLRIILTERDRKIAGWACVPMAWGGRQQAMETAQHWDSTAKNQPAEIAMFQILEVQESPAFNGRRSFLALRANKKEKSPHFVRTRDRSDLALNSGAASFGNQRASLRCSRCCLRDGFGRFLAPL